VLCAATQVLLQLCKAVQQGRSQARRVHALAVDRPPSELRALGVQRVANAFTDPCGWLATPLTQQPGSSSGVGGDQQQQQQHHASSSVQWRDLQALQGLCHSPHLCSSSSAVETGPGSDGDAGTACLVVAGLSTLLQRHSSMQVGAPGAAIGM
jgi:hypothetical protein